MNYKQLKISDNKKLKRANKFLKLLKIRQLYYIDDDCYIVGSKPTVKKVKIDHLKIDSMLDLSHVCIQVIETGRERSMGLETADKYLFKKKSEAVKQLKLEENNE